jgi:methionyl-tRNA formyltransferase
MGGPEAATAPGTVAAAGPRLVVACGRGAVEVLEVQQEGRRQLPAEAFLRGYALETGDRLG